MTKQVSGSIFDLSGAAVANAVCTVTPLDALVGQDGGARAQNTRTYTANGSGVLTIPDIKIGRYSFVAFVPATPSTAMTVAREGVILITSETPDEATLEQVLQANAEPLTPSLVQQALNAASAAAASAVSAAASSAGAGAASGRSDVGSFAELATEFVYADPEAGQRVVAAGDVILWRGASASYEVVASGGNLDYTGTGGVLLRVLAGADGRFSALALGLCDGADAAARLVALTNQGITHINIPRGETVLLNTLAEVTNLADFSLGGEGTLDCSGGGQLAVLGTHDNLPALSASTSKGARSVTFGTAHSLSVGDCVVLWNPTDFSAGLARNYYRQGWRGIVASVDSTTQITFFGRIPPAIDHTVWLAARVRGGGFALRDGLTIIPNTTTSAPVRVFRRRIVRITAPTIPAGSGYTNLNISQCYDVHCVDPRSTALVSDAYPINIGSCQKVILDRVTASFSTRHVQAIGGGSFGNDVSGAGNTPTREVTVVNSFLQSSGGVGAGDFHGATFEGSFRNCRFDPNVTMGGGDLELSDCEIVATNGRCVRFTELFGGYVRLNQCRLVTYEGESSEGVIYLLNSFLSEDLLLQLNDCTWVHRGASGDTVRPIIVGVPLVGAGWDASTGNYPASPTHSSTYEVTVAGTVDGVMRNVGEYWVYSSFGNEFLLSTKPKIEVLVSNPVLRGASSYNFCTLTGSQVMDDRFSLSVDKIDGPGGNLFVASRIEHQSLCKLRLPKQTIAIQAATVIGQSSNITGIFNFKWGYPRRPLALSGWHRPQNGLMANEDVAAVCQIADLRSPTVRLWLRRVDGTTWAAAKDIILTVEAWIDNL